MVQPPVNMQKSFLPIKHIKLRLVSLFDWDKTLEKGYQLLTTGNFKEAQAFF